MSRTENPNREPADHEVELFTTSEGVLLCNTQRPAEWFQSTVAVDLETVA